MKAAIDFRRARPAFSRKNVVLTRRSQWKSRRLTYETNSSFGPEHALRELPPCKPDRSSLCETIRLAQQGDAAAFEVIYQQHSGRVYALCLRMLRDPVEAEDLVQEVVYTAIAQDSYLSGRIGLFDLVASVNGKPCSDAPPQKETCIHVTR